MTGDWVSLIDSFFVCMVWGWGFGKPLKRGQGAGYFPAEGNVDEDGILSYFVNGLMYCNVV
jgi:hypothetical protein